MEAGCGVASMHDIRLLYVPATCARGTMEPVDVVPHGALEAQRTLVGGH